MHDAVSPEIEYTGHRDDGTRKQVNLTQGRENADGNEYMDVSDIEKVNERGYNIPNDETRRDRWVRTKEVFAAALKASGMTQLRLAQITGFPEQSIGQKINIRESVRVNEFLILLDAMGIDPEFIVRETGETVPLKCEGIPTEKEIFYSVLKPLKLTKGKAADLIGEDRQLFHVKIDIRQSIRMDAFIEMLEVLGIDTIFRIRSTGDVLSREKEYQPKIGFRVKGVSDFIKYDTADSEPLASSFYADGENEYGPDGKALVLYRDTEGRYFAVEYRDDENFKGKVWGLPVHMAEAFAEKYGPLKLVGKPI